LDFIVPFLPACQLTFSHRIMLKCWFPSSKQASHLVKIFLNAWTVASFSLTCLSCLAKNESCYTLSVLLLVPWIMVSGLIYHTSQNLFFGKMQAVWFCLHALQFKETRRNVTNCMEGFVTPAYVILTVHILM
jgi:hypothetical protein